MKIAVYTIAKNEEQFVARWAESCSEADYRLILDTGSTDSTYKVATDLGINIYQHEFKPWRFDKARNHVLAVLPEDIDICIALDMDEVLQPGWRQALESISAGITRPRYKYVWSWKPDGSEGLVYGGDKIHARHGYYWAHPVHEVLKPVRTENQEWVDGLEIHHHPDHTKSRGQYLPLLELAVEEDPFDDRNQFYLAREYFFNGQWDKAIEHFNRHLDLSNWPAEKAASLRFIAKIDEERRIAILYDACAIDPGRRESWVALADAYHQKRMWQPCRNACFNALAIETKPLDYLCEDWAWGERAADLMALASHKLGLKSEAIKYGTLALQLNPDDQRLKDNLYFYAL